ncbi:AAA family ATPase [Kitasatospora viridis]|uniref:AAA domain-containing protein n=1 Tax=Kitasatospora viridis TaxID=281105 RepID=A0A561UFN1_9ACTN|nr:ATP-binding protein [Kitasatospora viridis]TWF98160.1 AAA domain-containing protein [Kitasatospora viridis]
MYVTRLGISGLRGFTPEREVRQLELPAAGWTVLAGRNGSGKTTLLRALALALGGPSVARSLVSDFSGWLTAGERTGWVQAFVRPDWSVDKLAGSGKAPKYDLQLGLRWSLGPPQHARPGGLRPELEVFGSASPERGPWAENPRGWFFAGYGPFRRLLGGAGESQRLMLSAGPVGRLATLFHEEASLAEGVSWLVDQHVRRLEGRPGAQQTLDVVVGLLSDGLLPDGFRVARVDSDGLWVHRGDGPGFPLRELSDGYRTVAALVLDLVRQFQNCYGRLPLDAAGALDLPGVVLIDEVDAHLHVSWQQRIGPWLTAHFPRVQFIVSTHSPYICQAASPGGLIRIAGPEEPVAPQPVSEELYRRVVYGSGDDAVLSELFGLESPYSARAEDARRRIGDLEGRVLAGDADDAELAEYQELTERLQSSLSARVDEVAARLGRRR